MTGGMIMALTRSKITIGTLRMILHTTPRSASTGKTSTVVSVRRKLNWMLSPKKEPELIQNLKGKIKISWK